MPLGILDTSVIIRHLTQDHPQLSARARLLFKQVEGGSLTLILPEGVLVEAVQVLSSKQLYNLPRAQIRALLTQLISLTGLKITHKSTYLRAFDLYASTSVDFVDCLIVAHAERLKITEVASFDHDFDRFPQISRREP